jgi:hypothetical protein
MRARAMEFPRSFKQLKELGDGGMFGLTGNDTDHSSGKVVGDPRLSREAR